jgi:hypothetical protein
LNHGENVGIFSRLPRMRSTFNEPSHLALFMAGVAPMVLNKSSVLFKIIFFLGLILTFSSSLAAGILLATLALFTLSIARNKIMKTELFILASLLILLIMAPKELLGKVYNVATSDRTRYEAFVNTVDYLVQNPFRFITGSGATSYYQFAKIGLFNWYLQVIMEAGIEGFLIFVLFLINASRFSRTTILCRFWLLAILFQYIGMNHYYIPGIWMLLAWIKFKDTRVLS